MREMKVFSCLVLLLISGSLLGSVTLAQKKDVAVPDFTQGDQIPDGHDHDWNLGSTGARGWIYCNRLETTQARQILITQIDDGSPAKNLLETGDVILGVNGEPFSFDPRVELGKAVTKAESTDGKLNLLRWRQGKTDQATISLEVLGSYSDTAPFQCQKSKRILERGCKVLAKSMSSTKQRNGIIRSLNAMALLASGQEEYLPIIDQHAKWAASYSDVEGRSLCCWYYGPINMFLAEYVIATGDKRYLPDLRRITMEIVGGQSAVGSWGHRFARPDGRLNGYGMMNAPGLPMTTSLILARKAGVSDSQLDTAIEKSVRLMRFYVGKGCVPYGDHHPWLETHDDNGKNGIAAIMFNILQDRDAAQFFSHMSLACHGAEREMGHTGNFFNMLWAMPGVAISGPNASGAWMKEFAWYYDLARRWDGTFQHQGAAQPKWDKYKQWDSTGAFLLAYAQPLRKIHITGKTNGVVNLLGKPQAQQLVTDGIGYSHRQKSKIYADWSVDELFEMLTSWSPVVRLRAARALAQRKQPFSDRLIEMLESKDLHAQLGACQALAQLGGRSAPAVPSLRQTLKSDNLWLRVKAADALAGIGDAARVAVPDLLSLLTERDIENDPRGMQQRYLCFALFNRRDGLLGRSLDGVDRQELYAAVRLGLSNQDGRARGALSTVYNNLSFDEIEPLLPAIHHAVVESAPSGIMFADGVRMAGLEILAKHRIKEGMQLCVDVMELDRWGSGNRIPKCLKALALYGSSAKHLVDDLEPLQQHLKNKRRKSDKDQRNIDLLKETIATMKSDDDPPTLRSLPSSY